jgi:hypothetical protein
VATTLNLGVKPFSPCESKAQLKATTLVLLLLLPPPPLVLASLVILVFPTLSNTSIYSVRHLRFIQATLQRFASSPMQAGVTPAGYLHQSISKINESRRTRRHMFFKPAMFLLRVKRNGM